MFVSRDPVVVIGPRTLVTPPASFTSTTSGALATCFTSVMTSVASPARLSSNLNQSCRPVSSTVPVTFGNVW